MILVTTNQRTPKNASQPSEIGRNLAQSLQREHSPTHTLISDLWSPQLSKEYLSAVLRYHQVMPQEMEWVNLTQMTIVSTTAGRNPLEEME